MFNNDPFHGCPPYPGQVFGCGRDAFSSSVDVAAEMEAQDYVVEVLAATTEAAKIISDSGGPDTADLERVVRPFLAVGKRRATAIGLALQDAGYSGGTGPDHEVGHPERGSGARKIMKKAFPSEASVDRLTKLFQKMQKDYPFDKTKRRKKIEAWLDQRGVNNDLQMTWDIYDAVWLAKQNGIDSKALLTASTLVGSAAGVLAVTVPNVGYIIAIIAGAVAGLLDVLAGAADEAGAEAAANAQRISDEIARRSIEKKALKLPGEIQADTPQKRRFLLERVEKTTKLQTKRPGRGMPGRGGQLTLRKPVTPKGAAGGAALALLCLGLGYALLRSK